jgi:HEAT repeat protein
MSDDGFGQAARPFDALNTRGLMAKREYVLGLEERADGEALSLLVECLCDESWYLRELAEGAFMRLGTEHVDVLLPLLEEGLWYTRTSVARILGRLGERRAVPALLRLTGDPNETVVEQAQVALVEIGSSKGAFRLAHALHGLPPDARRARLQDIARRDRTLADRMQRMMDNDELMSAADPEAMPDDHPLVRTSEEGVEWEVLTGPSSPKEKSHDRGDTGGAARSR